MAEGALFLVTRVVCTFGFISFRTASGTSFHLKKCLKKKLREVGGSVISLVQTLEVISQWVDIDADELWNKKSRLWRAPSGDSIACHAVCSHMALGRLGPGLRSQSAWDFSGWICRENVLCSEENIHKPVDTAGCGFLSPLQASTPWTTWTMACNNDGTWQGITPSGGTNRTAHLNRFFLTYLCWHRCGRYVLPLVNRPPCNFMQTSNGRVCTSFDFGGVLD